MEIGTKLRILYLYQHLLRYSDAKHPISTGQLIDDLKAQYGIDVNRNTLANDLAMLHKSGFNIEVIHSQGNSYYIDMQTFDVAELKIMIDAVSSAKFITKEKSEALIEKLLSLTSVHNADQLRRHVYVKGRVKSDNEKGYSIIDAINEAIDIGRKIRFQYTDYSIKKRKILRHDGEYYIVSPYALIWDGDYYYVVGFDEKRRIIQSFRLDRIYKTPEIMNEESIPCPKRFNVDVYSQSVFRMYDKDELMEVELFCRNHIMNHIVDRFGKNVQIKVMDDDHFIVKVKVCISPIFYGWIFGWNGDIRILGPEKVIEEFKRMAKKGLN